MNSGRFNIQLAAMGSLAEAAGASDGVGAINRRVLVNARLASPASGHVSHGFVATRAKVQANFAGFFFESHRLVIKAHARA
tara:strand:+ start:2153 stop:2395 length:243 start_codon:yes stop_codon:yes gene_type:complete